MVYAAPRTLHVENLYNQYIPYLKVVLQVAIDTGDLNLLTFTPNNFWRRTSHIFVETHRNHMRNYP